MFRRYRSGHGERGQSLVEMVIVLLLLLPLLAGAVDLGRAFFAYVIITNASREGARYASHFPDLESFIIETAVQEAESGGLTTTGMVVVVDPVGADPGYPIRVNVTYPFTMIMGDFLGMGSTIDLTASTEMVVFGTE